MSVTENRMQHVQYCMVATPQYSPQTALIQTRDGPQYSPQYSPQYTALSACLSTVLSTASPQYSPQYSRLIN